MKNLLLSLTLLIASAGMISAQGLSVGDQAADFELKNTDGEMVSLSGLEGNNGAIIIFSCNHCPYVKAYESRMIMLHNNFASKGYPVIAINSNDTKAYPDDSYENMQVRAKEKGFPFDYVIDPTQETAKAYGATRTPHVYVLEKNDDGTYEVAYIGAIDDNTQSPSKVKNKYVEAAIAAIEEGKEPDPSFTKAVGCSIKFK